jgi:two-component system, LuxR family, response regulator FixJ
MAGGPKSANQQHAQRLETITENSLISVVDDDESARDSIRCLLRSAGYRVATFESGELFLESEALRNTGCLILDIGMAGMDGLEVQRRLNGADAVVPIIFVTAQADRKSRQVAIEAGASDFFPKPFPTSDLLAAIETALQHSPEFQEAEKGR